MEKIMNKFEKQLEKWNRGVLRGAQARLAKALGVSTATTALWATGKRRPSKGYAEQMARLFSMDAFDVYKLFDGRSIVYPDVPTLSARSLRERRTEDCSYITQNKNTDADGPTEQSNSVQLPFLNTVPDESGRYEESDVLEWWTLPRRFAQGAKYILRAADAGLKNTTAEDVCFVKPSADMPQGKLVLFRTPEGSHVCRRIVRRGQKTVYALPDGQTAVQRQPGRAVGILLKLVSQL